MTQKYRWYKVLYYISELFYSIFNNYYVLGFIVLKFIPILHFLLQTLLIKNIKKTWYFQKKIWFYNNMLIFIFYHYILDNWIMY